MTPKVHPRFPWYEVHPDGRVFRVRLAPLAGKGNAGRIGEVKGRILKQSGYRQFNLLDADRKRILIRANRLVCETFSGPPPSPKHHAAHNNGIRLDNRSDNLRWATAKENCFDLNIHGTRPRGTRVSNASLNDAQFAEVMASYTGKRGQIKALAIRFGTGCSTMNRIVHGKTYVDHSGKRA